MLNKSIAVVFVAIALMFSVSACGSTPHESKSPVGHWTMAGETDPSFDMSAVVGQDSISITWKTNDLKALYWKGTFSKIDKKIVSVGDKDAMSTSALASQDSTKTFTYDGETISYDMTVMGVTRTIRLKR